MAAKNLQIGNLPLLVTPHPLNDLNPEEVRELARVSYPVVLQQICSQETIPLDTRIDFVHPAVRRRQANAAKSGAEK